MDVLKIKEFIEKQEENISVMRLTLSDAEIENEHIDSILDNMEANLEELYAELDKEEPKKEEKDA